VTKLSISFLLLSVSLFATTNPYPFSCQEAINTDFVAKYEMQTPKTTTSVNYYRQASKIAYEYPEQGMTEVWIKMPHNQTSLIRGFDHYKKSIEYEPIDLKMENKNSSWTQQENFLSPAQFGFKEGSKSSINGCVISHFERKENGKSILIDWYEPKKLLLSFEMKNREKTSYKYTLSSFEKITPEVNHLQNVLNYDATDFADIGDNESDPFFRKMINLGFISHHEANIIDENGNRIETQEHHKH